MICFGSVRCNSYKRRMLTLGWRIVTIGVSVGAPRRAKGAGWIFGGFGWGVSKRQGGRMDFSGFRLERLEASRVSDGFLKCSHACVGDAGWGFHVFGCMLWQYGFESLSFRMHVSCALVG